LKLHSAEENKSGVGYLCGEMQTNSQSAAITGIAEKEKLDSIDAES
jgi:hypothetical protein